MGPTKLDMLEKSPVLALVSEGLTNREIARQIGRSEAAVQRAKKAASVLGTSATQAGKRVLAGSGKHTKEQTSYYNMK
ncbi:hypothetical protein Pmani_002554 [Petrolisthes manimaculis]|uniref:Uncharacterized protein n=1 Tax=Petrolisthes manimaculis TaxID=1843537 RepID=A0AAE1QIA8_9EUCA|nr:hypothetical protein Pmani_002554 [Petrolisthes manimaculis]